MARKMDMYRADRDRLKAIDEQMAKHNKAIRELKAEREPIDAHLQKVMRTSTEGTIDGHVAFKIKVTERSTATTARVREFAPKLAGKIIQKNVSKKIEVV